MNSRRIAAGTQLRGVLWRELKEWPLVLGIGYCVSGPFSHPVFCPFFYEYHPSIQAIPVRNLFIWQKGAGKKKVSGRGVVENLLEDRQLLLLSTEETTMSPDLEQTGM